VLQTDNPGTLASINETEGPAIAALVPSDAARFEHRPGSGESAGLQLTVEALPEEEPRRALGRISAFQQAEELRQLRVLTGATRITGSAVAGDAAVDATPATDADVLAAWILGQGNQGAA
jgi:hypothetical protein